MPISQSRLARLAEAANILAQNLLSLSRLARDELPSAITVLNSLQAQVPGEPGREAPDLSEAIKLLSAINEILQSSLADHTEAFTIIGIETTLLARNAKRNDYAREYQRHRRQSGKSLTNKSHNYPPEFSTLPTLEEINKEGIIPPGENIF